jgi:hypothetical protein
MGYWSWELHNTKKFFKFRKYEIKLFTKCGLFVGKLHSMQVFRVGGSFGKIIFIMFR